MAEAFDLHGPDINDNFGLGEEFRDFGKELYERDKGDNRDEDNGHGDTYSFGETDTYNGPYEQTSNQDEFNFETASAPNEVEKPEEISIPTYEPMDFSFLSVDSDSEEEKDKYRNKTYATSEQMDDFFGFMKDKQTDYDNREFERKEKERKEKEIDDFRNELKNGLDSLKTNVEKSKDKRPDFEIKSAVPPSPGSGTRAQLEKDAKTSPMYAEAGVLDSSRKSTDEVVFDYDKFKSGLEKGKTNIHELDYNGTVVVNPIARALGFDLGRTNVEAWLDDMPKGGIDSKGPELARSFANTRTQLETLDMVEKVIDNMKSRVSKSIDQRAFYDTVYNYVLENGNSTKNASQLASEYSAKLGSIAENAVKGDFNSVMSYFNETGDTLGDRDAQNIQNIQNATLVALSHGEISKEDASNILDITHSISSRDQVQNLMSDNLVQAVISVARSEDNLEKSVHEAVKNLDRSILSKASNNASVRANNIQEAKSPKKDIAAKGPYKRSANVEEFKKNVEDMKKANDATRGNVYTKAQESLNNELEEQKFNEQKQLYNIEQDFDFSNAKPLETKEVGWGPFKHEVLADNKIAGLYTPQQMKEMDNFIRKTESKLGQNITDVANKVTAGIAPTTEDITGKFDRQNYKSAVDKVAQDYLSKGKDVQQAIDDVNKMVENASMGLAKAGVDYYLLTGDALNKTAESVQAVENQILVSLEKGIITEESALEAIDKAHQITNMDQLKSLATSPALQGIEITLATAAGATLLAKAASKIAPIVVDKLLKSNSKIGNKILEKLANNPAVKQNYKNRAFQEVFEAQKASEQGGRVLTIDDIKRAGELQKIIVDNHKAYEKAFDDFLRKNPKSTLEDWHNYADKIPELKKFRAAQEESADLSKLIDLSKEDLPDVLTGLDKEINKTKMKMAQSRLDHVVEYAISKSDDLSVNDIRSLMSALEDGTIDAALLLDASTQTIVDAIHKNGGDVAKVAAAIGAGTAAVDKASATPTGTFDKSGKQVDSKEIVSEYQKNPYTGEDAVTLQTREGQVTLPLHEAVIVGEAEKLTPERGYTEEVKKAAEGMDVYERQPETRKAEVVDINNLPPDLPEKSFWTKAGDVVQAILGGRDTNNDRTISAQEWYESTLKPAADSIKDFFSLPDFKSKLEAIGNKVEATLYNITSSIPGVIDLKTGEVQTIDQPIKATKETINNIEDKIINALPNWTDGVKNETIKEGVAGVVAGKIGNQLYGDSVAAVTLAKMAGAYTAATIGEIAHLYGKDLTNDEKGAINLVVTNAVGLPLAPVTSIVRDMQAMTGIPARARIEKTFNPDEAGSIMIIPYSEGTSGRSSSGTKSSYGWSSDITNADSKYSGYRERAKNTNLATDYNEGLAQEMNEAVSDMKVKIFNVYKNEPDYIRKAIDKVLKSYKEQW